MKGLSFGVFMAVALLWALLTWPFRAVAKRWPGRRENHLRAFLARYTESVPTAVKLVETLADGTPDAIGKLQASIRGTRSRIERYMLQGGSVETLNVTSDSAWDNAIRVLERMKRVGSIDWRAEPEELKKAMAPLLTHHGIDLDWSFISDLENLNDWNSLKSENLLPIVGQRLAAHGVILVGIEEGTDRYVFAICPQKRFSEIESLKHEHRSVYQLATQT